MLKENIFSLKCSLEVIRGCENNTINMLTHVALLWKRRTLEASIKQHNAWCVPTFFVIFLFTIYFIVGNWGQHNTLQLENYKI